MFDLIELCRSKMMSYLFLFTYPLKVQRLLSVRLLDMEISRSMSGWNSSSGENFSRVRKVIWAFGKANLMVLSGDVAKIISPMELNLITSIFWSGLIII